MSVQDSLPWLLSVYVCTSVTHAMSVTCWFHTAVPLDTTQPCLYHHSFVHPGGLYPCLDNYEKLQFRACIRCNSVSPVRAFACLKRHAGCDSTCLWCQTPVREGTHMYCLGEACFLFGLYSTPFVCVCIVVFYTFAQERHVC